MPMTITEVALMTALRPFADFADPRRTAPPGLPISQGSGMARRQLTMGDCYRAADAIATLRAESDSRDRHGELA